jgi:type IV secretion system pilin
MRVTTSHPHTPRARDPHGQHRGHQPDGARVAGAGAPVTDLAPGPGHQAAAAHNVAHDGGASESATEPSYEVPVAAWGGWGCWARRVAGALTLLAGLVVVVVLLSWVNIGLAHAADPADVVVLAQGGTTDEVNTLLQNATKWLVGILAAAATLFLTIGGVRYIFANGNPSEIEHAKSALRNAGIGYLLAALAPLIFRILQEIVPVQK